MPADEIEQGDIDRRFRAAVAMQRGCAAFGQQCMLQRVCADQERCEILVHRRDHACLQITGHGGRRGRFSPADKPIFSFDPDQQVFREFDAHARHQHRLVQRERDGDRFNAFDAQRCA